MKKILSLIVALIFLIFPTVTNAAEDTVTRIILVRHGETDYNKSVRYQGWIDIPLNETGIRQAEVLAESLKDVPIDVFISSPLQRAYLTTQKVAQLHGMGIEYTDPRLREIDFGDWSGKYAADLKKNYPEQFAVWMKKPWLMIFPNGESLQDVQNRGRAAINDIVARYPGKTIFIGAHSLFNITAICSIMDIDLNHFYQIPQMNTCVNVFEYRDGVWQVITINSLAHLNRLY